MNKSWHQYGYQEICQYVWYHFHGAVFAVLFVTYSNKFIILQPKQLWYYIGWFKFTMWTRLCNIKLLEAQIDTKCHWNSKFTCFKQMYSIWSVQILPRCWWMESKYCECIITCLMTTYMHSTWNIAKLIFLLLLKKGIIFQHWH